MKSNATGLGPRSKKFLAKHDDALFGLLIICAIVDQIMFHTSNL